MTRMTCTTVAPKNAFAALLFNLSNSLGGNTLGSDVD
jgi:hypothetical protein